MFLDFRCPFYRQTIQFKNYKAQDSFLVPDFLKQCILIHFLPNLFSDSFYKIFVHNMKEHVSFFAIFVIDPHENKVKYRHT